jgi:hypothetical protein
MVDITQIEKDLATNRRLYLEAIWAGRIGQADYYETEVDRLLSEWVTAHRETV